MFREVRRKRGRVLYRLDAAATVRADKDVVSGRRNERGARARSRTSRGGAVLVLPRRQSAGRGQEWRAVRAPCQRKIATTRDAARARVERSTTFGIAPRTSAGGGRRIFFRKKTRRRRVNRTSVCLERQHSLSGDDGRRRLTLRNKCARGRTSPRKQTFGDLKHT